MNDIILKLLMSECVICICMVILIKTQLFEKYNFIDTLIVYLCLVVMISIPITTIAYIWSR